MRIELVNAYSAAEDILERGGADVAILDLSGPNPNPWPDGVGGYTYEHQKCCHVLTTLKVAASIRSRLDWEELELQDGASSKFPCFYAADLTDHEAAERLKKLSV